MSQTELAATLGVRQSVIGMIESGARRRTAYLPRIAAALGVSVTWLDSGDGPMGRAVGEPPADPYFPDDESRLLRAFRLATPDLRRSLLRQADGILEDLDNPSQLTGNDNPAPG